MEEKKYPYLGRTKVEDKVYVVLFTEPDYGVVLMSEFTDEPSVAFGRIGDFAEEKFEYLPKEICVRLEN